MGKFIKLKGIQGSPMFVAIDEIACVEAHVIDMGYGAEITGTRIYLKNSGVKVTVANTSDEVYKLINEQRN